MSVYDSPLYTVLAATTTLILLAGAAGPPAALAHHFSEARQQDIFASQCAFIETLAEQLHRMFPEKTKSELLTELGLPAELVAVAVATRSLAKARATAGPAN